MPDTYALLCRFIVRDFVYSGDLIQKQREELAAADTTEKELWVGDYRSTLRLRFLSICIDGAAATFENKFLGSVSNPGAPQGASSVRRERAPVRSSSELRWLCRKGWLHSVCAPSSISCYTVLARTEIDQTHVGHPPVAIRIPRSAVKPFRRQVERQAEHRGGRHRRRVPDDPRARVLRLRALRGTMDYVAVISRL